MDTLPMLRSYRYSSVLIFAAAMVVLGGKLGASRVDENLSDRVLVVYNKDFSDSKQVAEYYMQKRGIPKSNVCAIQSPGLGSSRISWEQLDPVMRAPIKKCLTAMGKDRILYIVMSFHTPYKMYP